MKDQKLVKMKVENFEGIQKIELSFSDEVTVISGENRAGKTSLINSFVAGLGGSKLLKLLDISDPIRKGQHEATVHAEFSDFRIERVFRRGLQDKLYVYPKRDDLPETEMKAPQSFLDQFLNMFQDPVLFQSLEKEKRNKLFLAMLGIADEFERLKREYDDLYADRRAINRVGKTLEGSLAGLTEPEDNLPDKPIDVSNLRKELEDINVIINRKTKKETELNARKERYLAAEESIKEVKADIEKLEAKLKSIEETKKTYAHQGQDLEKELTEMYIPDKSIVAEKLDNADVINKKIQHRDNYVAVENQLGDNKIKADQYTTFLEENVSDREKLFKTSKFPIKGLSYNVEEGITYNKIPYDQLSTEEQSSVSAQIAMVKREHNIKVLILRNASNYTEKSFEAIKKEALANGFQLIVEKPGTAELEAVIIENGKIKE